MYYESRIFEQQNDNSNELRLTRTTEESKKWGGNFCLLFFLYKENILF